MKVDALLTIGAVNVLLWAMIAYETIHVYDERRYRFATGSRSTSQVANGEPGRRGEGSVCPIGSLVAESRAGRGFPQPE